VSDLLIYLGICFIFAYPQWKLLNWVAKSDTFELFIDKHKNIAGWSILFLGITIILNVFCLAMVIADLYERDRDV